MCACAAHIDRGKVCTCDCRSHEIGFKKLADYEEPSLVGSDPVERLPLSEQLARLHRMLDDAGALPSGTVEERLRSFIAEAEAWRRHVDPGAVAVPEVGDDPHWLLKVALTNWWIDLAHAEVDRVVPKAVEYGSTDLMEVGRTLANVMQRDGLSEEELTELGIYFYLVGKFARWMDAVRDNRRASDDTLHDIGVYVRMAQRTRAVGGWPAGPDDKEPDG